MCSPSRGKTKQTAGILLWGHTHQAWVTRVHDLAGDDTLYPTALYCLQQSVRVSVDNPFASLLYLPTDNLHPGQAWLIDRFMVQYSKHWCLNISSVWFDLLEFTMRCFLSLTYPTCRSFLSRALFCPLVLRFGGILCHFPGKFDQMFSMLHYRPIFSDSNSESKYGLFGKYRS